MLGYMPQKGYVEVGRAFRYQPPTWLQFKTPLMQSVYDVVRNSVFKVAEDGKIKQPATMNTLKFTMNKTTYNMGIGGLHSCEELLQVVPADDEEMWDADVTSYYPICIINQQLYPEHLGPRFIDIFVKIVQRRIEAKMAHDDKTAQTLKIVVNGSYGKFGSPYSILYAPNLIIQTTLTGQLALLMLIETFELNGIEVVSANTDGIVVEPNKARSQRAKDIIKEWEQVTGFEMELNQYLRLNSANVNNYVAIKADGKVKRKGWFGETGLQKNQTFLS